MEGTIGEGDQRGITWDLRLQFMTLPTDGRSSSPRSKNMLPIPKYSAGFLLAMPPPPHTHFKTLRGESTIIGISIHSPSSTSQQCLPRASTQFPIPLPTFRSYSRPAYCISGHASASFRWKRITEEANKLHHNFICKNDVFAGIGSERRWSGDDRFYQMDLMDQIR